MLARVCANVWRHYSQALTPSWKHSGNSLADWRISTYKLPLPRNVCGFTIPVVIDDAAFRVAAPIRNGIALMGVKWHAGAGSVWFTTTFWVCNSKLFIKASWLIIGFRYSWRLYVFVAFDPDGKEIFSCSYVTVVILARVAYTPHTLSLDPLSALSSVWLGVLENEGRRPTGRFKWAFQIRSTTATTPWEIQREKQLPAESFTIISLPSVLEWIILFYQLWRTMGGCVSCFFFFLYFQRWLVFTSIPIESRISCCNRMLFWKRLAMPKPIETTTRPGSASTWIFTLTSRGIPSVDTSTITCWKSRVSSSNNLASVIFIHSTRYPTYVEFCH